MSGDAPPERIFVDMERGARALRSPECWVCDVSVTSGRPSAVDVEYIRTNLLEFFFLAYGRGVQARAAGCGRYENPFTCGTEQFELWQQGWERHP